MKPTPEQSPQAFWDDRYRDASHKTSGLPSALLERFATDRVPGSVLDLGCAKGDDAIWLAGQGWDVVAVDIAQSALDIACANAVARGVEDRILFARHDLTESFPDGKFDLISAMFLQTPFDFPRREVFERALDHLKPNGLLLVVTHGSAAPWSWGKHDHKFPTPEKELAVLGYSKSDTRVVFAGSESRNAKGPDGQTAEVLDNVIALTKN
jgi:SAM-dependent methyltransferase